MKANQRREEIIKVAAKLFKERGFNAVSMRDIAAEMDIKAASLYNHIKGKNEILSAIILTVAKEFTIGMESVVAKNTNSVQKIEQIIGLHIDITVNYSDALASLNNDWIHLEENDRESFLRMRNGYEDNFRDIIKAGISNGELKPNQPEVVLFAILSTLRTLYLWHEKRGKLEVNILKKDMVSVLIKGII